MKKAALLFIPSFFATTVVCLILSYGKLTAQIVPSEYYVFIKKADSLYHAGDYNNSALAYSSAFATFGWKGFVDDRYKAACAWAMADNTDSAFFNLQKIALRTGYSNHKKLSSDTALSALHNDKRWIRLLDNVTVNFLLDSMVKEDQKWRKMTDKIDNKEVDSISMKDVMAKWMLTDSLNYYIIKDIFEKHGFIGFDTGGEMVSNNFWVLVQHADRHPEFQQAVLDKMKMEVYNGNASTKNYAYLVDRVKVNTGQLQVYGTQMHLNKERTSYEPQPCIDPDKLNERRKEMQLPSIEEYIKIMNEHYHGSLKKN